MNKERIIALGEKKLPYQEKGTFSDFLGFLGGIAILWILCLIF